MRPPKGLVPEPPPKVDFTCPICGSSEYDDVRHGPKGGYSTRVHCSCSGCSVIFHDPTKFSAAKKKED